MITEWDHSFSFDHTFVGCYLVSACLDTYSMANKKEQSATGLLMLLENLEIRNCCRRCCYCLSPSLF